MRIKNAEEKHIPFIKEAEARIFSDGWSESALCSHLASSASRTLVAEEDGRMLGYLLGCVILPEGEIYRVASLPEARRRGVATALLNAFLEELPVCFLEVRQSNRAARTLYEKHGFSLVAERKNYYKAPAEDACIYKREIK